MTTSPSKEELEAKAEEFPATVKPKPRKRVKKKPTAKKEK